MDIEKILLPTITALLGAAVAYLVAIRTETKKKHIEERTKCYVDYVKSVAKIKHDPGRDSLISLTDAIARISVYGSSEVVKSLGNFSDTKMILDDTDSIKAFLKIIEKIREETSDVVDVEVLQKILFGSNS